MSKVVTTKRRYPEGWNKGERHPTARLTWLLVAEIRALPKYRHALRPFAAKLGISYRTLCDIRGGRSWRFDEERERHRRALTDIERRALPRMHPVLAEAFKLRECEGLSYREIAERLGRKLPTIATRVYKARLFIQRLAAGA